MGKPDINSKPVKHFSILIVPRGRGPMRRFELSGRVVRVFKALAVFGVLAFIAAVSSLVFYRHAYHATNEVRVEGANFVRERAALLKRLGELEESLNRTDRFAAKIESAMNKGGEGVAGKGPVDEDDSLSASEWQPSSGSSVALGKASWKSPLSSSLSAGLGLKLDELSARNGSVEKRVHTAFSLQQDKLFFWASLPSLWPARGFVTSDFGDRRGFRRRSRLHEGIDIASSRGTPITAPGDGVVTYSGYYHGYGQMLTIDHGYGISTLYGHCSAVYVAEGQRVKRGTIIAAVGNTGSSTGPHLHYEIHVDGIPVNPMMYVMQ